MKLGLRTGVANIIPVFPKHSQMNLKLLKKGIRIRARLSSAVRSESRITSIAGNLSRVARAALDEASRLTVEDIEIRLKKLPEGLDGMRVVHLSDIHHSPFVDLEHIDRTVELSNSLQPDLIVLTGDFVSHEKEYISPMARALSELSAPLGVYACLGNHDHWTDPHAVTGELIDNGIRVLINEGERIETDAGSLWMCGVDDYMVGKTDVSAAILGSEEHEAKLLLAHNPAIVRQAARRGVDLMFSGHTHGGQVKLKRSEDGGLMKSIRMRNGLHRRYETQVYITRGIGTVVVPIRYQCPPEISHITLRKA